MLGKKDTAIGLVLSALIILPLMALITVVEVIRFSINLITSLVFKRKVFVKQDMLKSISK
mgnify:CR=1 FL=1